MTYCEPVSKTVSRGKYINESYHYLILFTSSSTSIYMNEVLLGSLKHRVHYLADKLHHLSGYISTTV